jgi:hypothetical protein
MDTDSLLQQLQRMRDLSIQMMDIGEEINSAGNGISSALEGGRGYELQSWVGNWYNRNQYKGSEVQQLSQAGSYEMEQWLAVDEKFHYDFDDWWGENIPIIPPPTEWFSGPAVGPRWQGERWASPDGLIKWGSYDVGAQVGLDEGGPVAGIFGEYNGIEYEDGFSYGSDAFAFTAGNRMTVGSAEGFAGFRDGSFGAEVGASAVSYEGTMGVNIGEMNVGLEAGVSVGWSWGFSVGKVTEIKLGPFTLGFTVGEAKYNPFD